MLKKLFCKHEFHFLTSYKQDGDEGVGYKPIEHFIVYCPKCGKKKILLKHEYESIMNQRRIDKEYQDGLKQDRDLQ